MKVLVEESKLSESWTSSKNISYHESFEKIARIVHNSSSKKNDYKFQINDSLFS
ncbi:MAG: hypothetical protein OEW67_12495 [Cyclobacteriaceae bacterium]|nr:hypothetical protein [Cyclobacteriaceae bacterium]